MPSQEIRHRVDLLHAQRLAREFAAARGFERRACQELAIVASELSSNILKYGKRGRLELEAVDDSGGAGMALLAYDEGPPFRSLENAVQDGYDDTGPIDPANMTHRNGLGAGLGAVLRLTHHFYVEPLPVGKRVVAVRYVGRPVARWPAPPAR